jgi:hypothetical protein
MVFIGHMNYFSAIFQSNTKRIFLYLLYDGLKYTAVTTKNAVFWDVMPCDSYKSRRRNISENCILNLK